MKSSSTKTIFLAVLLLGFFSSPFQSEARLGHERGVEYTRTIFHLTPKQFAKGYNAEKRAYSHEKGLSTRRMHRKQHGTWIQRLFTRRPY